MPLQESSIPEAVVPAVRARAPVPLLSALARVPGWTWLTVAGVLWLASSAAWVIAPWGGAVARLVWGIFYDLPVGPIIALLCWRAARAAGDSARLRRGWLLFGSGYFISWCGNCVYNYNAGIVGIEVFPSLADVFFLSAYPLLFLALLHFTAPLASRNEQLKFGLDIATVMVSAVVALWYFVLRHIEADSDATLLARSVSLAYPLMDILLAFGVSIALLKQRSAQQLGPVLLLMASQIAMFSGDVIYMIATTESTYVSGGVADICFIVSFALMMIAAESQTWVRQVARAATTPDYVYQTHWAPYVAVAAAYALLLFTHLGQLIDPAGVFALTALLLTGLTTLRQVLAHHENADLRARHVMRKVEARFSSLVKNSSDIIMVVDDQEHIRFATPSAEKSLGYALDALHSAPLTTLAHPDDLIAMREFLRDLTHDPTLIGPVEWRLATNDGDWRRIEVIGTNLLDDPAVEGLVLNCRDITERKHLEEQLRYLAFTDPLTRLANRTVFNDRLQVALNHRDVAEQHLAVIFADLDNFKKVNDSLGHEMGDRLLAIAAKRLVRATRSIDTVARLGGDEFALLIESAQTTEEIIALAERLLATLSQPYELERRSIPMSCSLGIAIACPADSAQDLLRNADLAMYKAKSAGKSCYRLYESAMHANVLERVELEVDLRRGLVEGEVFPHYQPIIDLRSGATVGVEALVRWRHSERGMIAPMSFIGIAEESDIIIDLGRQMLNAACAQGSRWTAEFPPETLQHLSVNISARQLEHPDLAADVARALDKSRLRPDRLVLEITESALMRDVGRVQVQLAALKSLGVRIALDDFGTGYSSLSYLHRFPIDILKIDRSFVHDLARSRDSVELVRSIVTLANALDMDTVAEGIETSEQAARLRSFGCSMGQGYLFARPDTPERIAPTLGTARKIPSLTLVSSS